MTYEGCSRLNIARVFDTIFQSGLDLAAGNENAGVEGGYFILIGNKGKVLLAFLSVGLLIGILVYGGWRAISEREYIRTFEEIRAGDFRAVQGLDAKQMQELEYVYKLTKESDRLAWIECDLNGDGKNELLMMESFENGSESTIAGIFMEKDGKCHRVLWDVHDYTSCYYLVENMVIKYSEDYVLGTQYCYVKYKFDPEGKMKQAKRFEILDFPEVEDIAPIYIWFCFVPCLHFT